jgi:small subunit ribosomal protein S16
MLAIRMQRTGRKGLSHFRVVVQDSQFSPSSGRVVAQVGHYNPHNKETVIDKDTIEKYLKNGAQPSPRVVKLLQSQKISLPDWVEKPDTDKKRPTKNPEKLRKNQPKEEAPVEETGNEAPEAEEKPAESEKTEETA